ncbi:unnamed protein product [Trichobilharzia regenti]|nr:unnamed protein product [Trichobilharzia regenti]
MEDKNDETVHTSHAPAASQGFRHTISLVRQLSVSATFIVLVSKSQSTASLCISVQEELESHDKSVKASHDKPMPKVTKPHNDNTRRIIQQPSK